LNGQPADYKSAALPIELRRQKNTGFKRFKSAKTKNHCHITQQLAFDHADSFHAVSLHSAWYPGPSSNHIAALFGRGHINTLRATMSIA
jgi:hypothetical protein